MLSRLIHVSLSNRLIVIALALAISAYGIIAGLQLPVDVFPDLNRPVVNIFVEAPGLAPEEIEARVTYPIENAINGARGVYRVRSTSIPGLALVFVDFDWEQELLNARQIVAERLQQVARLLPRGVQPIVAPTSSLMGEIMLVGLSSDGSLSDLHLREIADWEIRPRLASTKGVSQVSVIGGERRELQVLVDPAALRHHQLSFHDIEEALQGSNANTSGGVLINGPTETIVRNLGALRDIDDLNRVILPKKNPSAPIAPTLPEVASLRYSGPSFRRGDAGVNGINAVVLSIQKQPGADTRELSARVTKTLDEISKSLPHGVTLHKNIFNQSRFIEAAIGSVKSALLEGALLVIIVLFLFLMNIRTAAITLISIPLSLLCTFVVFQLLGLSINTMTLGGLAIAIGELVDDAIVDVENVFRRLRENRKLSTRLPALQVIFNASAEVRRSIVNATVIVILVFVPLFALGGIEGRIFAPLGLGYIISILASLLVSLTVTPVLCSVLLPMSEAINVEQETALVRFLKRWQNVGLRQVIARPYFALGACAILLGVGAFTASRLGMEFLPPFNEGSVTIGLSLPPGTSLPESSRIGRLAEKLLLEIPEFSLVGRRTGRAELDEHAEGVHYNELEAEILPSERSRDEILDVVRQKLNTIPGVVVNIGQPISHRIDHLLSGVRAQIALKIFGPDLTTLREQAEQTLTIMKGIPGIVDTQIETQTMVPQLHVRINRNRTAQYGVNAGELAEYVETALNGKVVTEMLEGQRTVDVVLRLEDRARNDRSLLRGLPVDVGDGKLVALDLLAELEEAEGPNQIARENGMRRIVVSANTAGRNLASTVAELNNALDEKVKMPQGYFRTIGGQFESQKAASRTIFLLSLLSLGAIFLVLLIHFGSFNLSLQVMFVEIPFAFVGAIFGIWCTTGVVSIASLVGLVTLCGIATRNGILMLDHYIHLMREEGEEFSLSMLYRGTAERLVPVLMTALTAMLALIPILIAPFEPGREILHPVAVVIFSGLIASTLLNLFITPLIFWIVGNRLAPPGLQPSLQLRALKE